MQWCIITEQHHGLKWTSKTFGQNCIDFDNFQNKHLLGSITLIKPLKLEDLERFNTRKQSDTKLFRQTSLFSFLSPGCLNSSKTFRKVSVYRPRIVNVYIWCEDMRDLSLWACSPSLHTQYHLTKQVYLNDETKIMRKNLVSANGQVSSKKRISVKIIIYRVLNFIRFTCWIQK